ncbi:rRNA small subunit pseudouridine methyltransferase Nep1 [Nematocida sp. AWRm77]|nr:rRNA small subunit pseudouridine methyltransferase Nep1 [Nematocida sp. AWRm77]
MLTVILQNAQLEINKSRSGKILLSSEHPEARRQKNPSVYRPDILHQCLLILQDSPLNKAGLLRVLVHTTAEKVIQIHPQARIPRVYSRFTGLVMQLLERGKIYAAETREVLLQVSRDPLSSFLEEGATKIGLSQEGSNFFVFMQNFQISEKGKQNIESETSSPARENACPALSPAPEALEKLSFFINVVSSGPDEFESDHTLSLSSYALSAATCCSKICCTLEALLGIF